MVPVSSRQYNDDRLARNADSKSKAQHDCEPWSSEDMQFLAEFWPPAIGLPAQEAEVAEAIGRTIEACRQRWYEHRNQPTLTTGVGDKRRTEYIGAGDDPDDQWWSPDYYREGNAYHG
jgi:hypothetical protein